VAKAVSIIGAAFSSLKAAAPSNFPRPNQVLTQTARVLLNAVTA